MYTIARVFIIVSGLLGSVQGSIEKPKTLALHGWLPTWRFQSGVREVVAHQNYFASISPFSFEVASSGIVTGSLPSKSVSWKLLASSSQAYKYPIVPTLAWFDGGAMLNVLSSSSERKKHIESIARTVRLGGYDGIDIDYEGRRVEVKKHYEDFVHELSQVLHKDKKILYCTAEARTPLEDAVDGVKLSQRGISPTTYRTLNQNCDSVRIMAYDQRDDDRELTSNNRDVFYRPVSDDAWVEKTIQEALYEVDRKKLVLGIPNYGNIYSATSTPTGRVRYQYVGALNEDKALSRAAEYHIRPIRNPAGELQFFYKKDGIRYWVTFTDEVSIKKKLDLAEKYGLSGVALFKFDGSTSDGIWEGFLEHLKERI